jgi:hypothetical protein
MKKQSNDADLRNLSQCHSQITHRLTWVRTQASAVKRWQLTTWAMAWPKCGGEAFFGFSKNSLLNVAVK